MPSGVRDSCMILIWRPLRNISGTDSFQFERLPGSSFQLFACLEIVADVSGNGGRWNKQLCTTHIKQELDRYKADAIYTRPDY